MRIGKLLLLAVAWSLQGCAPTTRPPQSKPIPATVAVDPDEPTQEDLAIEAKMQVHLADLRFNATPLATVMDDIRTKSGLNIVVDWAALEKAGIPRNTPVMAKLHDIKLSKALELVFKSVEGEEENRKLGYRITNGAINISTRGELNKRVVTRTYDISDMVAGFPDRNLRIAESEKFLTDNVDTDTWQDNGGDVGTVATGPNNTLVIIQTPEAQWKIKDVLSSLRESQKPTTGPAQAPLH